jgi:membrane-associated protease RseP (regulator of RpoE activity)
MEGPFPQIEATFHIRDGLINLFLGHIKPGVLGRAQKQQFPTGDRQVGLGRRTGLKSFEIARASRIAGIDLGENLPGAGKDQSFLDGIPDPAGPFAVGHAVSFAEHEAGNGVVIGAGMGQLTPARSRSAQVGRNFGHVREETVGHLTGKDIVDGPIKGFTVGAEAGLMAGDLVYAVDGEVISFANPLNEIVQRKLGQEVDITVLREGQWQTISATPRAERAVCNLRAGDEIVDGALLTVESPGYEAVDDRWRYHMLWLRR